MAFQNLILPIVSVFRSAGIQAARGALGGLNKDLESFAKQAGKAAMAFAGAQAIMSTTQFITQSVEVAQQYERNMLALEQVFENITPKMAAFTKQAEMSGIGSGQAAQASVFLGSVLKQYGLDVSVAADETQNLVLLAQDLATTYGYDLQEALLAMTALFRGEYDPIEKFGVAMKQNEINALVAARGQEKLTGTMLFQAQVQARLDLLYERSADASGAFSRASDTLYVSQQKLSAAFQNLQVATGEPFQRPLSAITDQFAKIAQDVGPKFVNIAETVAKSMTLAAPAFIAIVELLGNLLVIMVPVIAILGGLAAALSLVITPLAKFLSYMVDLSSDVIDGVITDLNRMEVSFLGLDKAISPEFMKAWDEFWTRPSMFQYEGSGLQLIISQLTDIHYLLHPEQKRPIWFTEDETAEANRFLLAAERTAVVVREALPPFSAFVAQMKSLGIYTADAEGNLTGLSGIFQEIADDAAKSRIASELEDMGFNASQIEYFLTKPDWAAIFGQISRLARIASIDIKSVNPFGVEYWEIQSAKDEYQKLLDAAFGGAPEKATGSVKKTVETIFDVLKTETAKQSARLQLEKKGASQGLIELILGRSDWMNLWIQIKQGIISLDSLQKSFNKTADGVKELDAALQDARDEAQDYIDKMQKEADRLKGVWDDAIERADAYKASIAELSQIDILPTLEPELGRFESQIISTFDAIRAKLQDGLTSEALTSDSYNTLVAYANQEAGLLNGIARQRDDLANRYSLSDALIKEYKSALTSALSLTSLFSSLKNETEKRTVTEISNSVVRLGGSLKEFNVTVTRSYEETIEKVVNKSQELLDGFRDMATKARGFAENLRTLQSMGLNGELFQQLVDAGVEAGGETAQALIDGGADTITEINGLFDEINTLGAELGEDVAQTLYDTGNEFGDSLLEGIAAKQQELEDLARSMAQAFNTEFSAKVSTATDIPVKAAKDAYDKAAAAVPEMKQIDVQALADLNNLIAGASKYIGNVSGDLQTGGTNKLSIYEALKQDVLSGAQLDLSGIKSGLGTAELIEAAKASGSTTINNTYNVVAPATADKVTAYSSGLVTAEGMAAFNASNGNPNLQYFGAK